MTEWLNSGELLELTLQNRNVFRMTVITEPAWDDCTVLEVDVDAYKHLKINSAYHPVLIFWAIHHCPLRKWHCVSWAYVAVARTLSSLMKKLLKFLYFFRLCLWRNFFFFFYLSFRWYKGLQPCVRILALFGTTLFIFIVSQFPVFYNSDMSPIRLRPFRSFISHLLGILAPILVLYRIMFCASSFSGWAPLITLIGTSRGLRRN